MVIITSVVVWGVLVVYNVIVMLKIDGVVNVSFECVFLLL